MTEKKTTKKAAVKKAPPIAVIKLQRRPENGDNYSPALRRVHVKMGDWEWQSNVSYVAAYCGAKFWWDFQTNYNMQRTMRPLLKLWSGREVMLELEKKEAEEVRAEAEQMMRLVLYAMCIEHIDAVSGLRGSRDTHHPKDWGWDKDTYAQKLKMDFTWWEVDYRVMYGFGLHHGADMLPPRRNPNSGNIASFFALAPEVDTYNDLYKEFKDTVEVEWVDSMYSDIDDLGDDEPFDDEPYEEEW